MLRTPSDPIPEDLIKSSEVTKLLNQMEKVRRDYKLVGGFQLVINKNLANYFNCRHCSTSDRH